MIIYVASTDALLGLGKTAMSGQTHPGPMEKTLWWVRAASHETHGQCPLRQPRAVRMRPGAGRLGGQCRVGGVASGWRFLIGSCLLGGLAGGTGMCSPCVPQAKAASQAKCTRVAGGSGCLPAAQEAVLRPPPHPQDCSFPRGPAAPGPMMSRPRALRLSQLLRSIAVCVCVRLCEHVCACMHVQAPAWAGRGAWLTLTRGYRALSPVGVS